MNGRLRVGLAAACAALLAAACDSGALTGTTFGTAGSPAGGTGTIVGQVTANGTGQGGITVIVINQDSTITGGTGAFTFAAIPSGTYQIAVRIPLGFALAAGQSSPRNVVVTNGGTTGVTFILQSTTTVP
jgi:ABC-type amino acid transport substrate-binding protein